MRSALALAPLALVFASALVSASEKCDLLREGAEMAEQALRACLRSGGSCTPEFTRRDSLRAAAEACVDIAPTPIRSVVASTSSTIAIHVEGPPGDERDAAHAAAQAALPGRSIVDKGTVRAAREFLEAASLDAVAAEKLRADVGADHLLVLELRAVGDTRFVALRVSSRRGAPPKPRYIEASAATLGAAITRIVAELFPSRTPAATETPQPLPTVGASASP